MGFLAGYSLSVACSQDSVSPGPQPVCAAMGHLDPGGCARRAWAGYYRALGCRAVRRSALRMMADAVAGVSVSAARAKPPWRSMVLARLRTRGRAWA